MPPCILAILSQLRDGKNTPHTARFAFATFALSMGVPPEGVASAFVRSPNYDAEKTRKQVASLAGKTPYSCSTMKQHGLCDAFTEVSLCAHINNPLSFGRIRSNSVPRGTIETPVDMRPVELVVGKCQCGYLTKPCPGKETAEAVLRSHYWSVPVEEEGSHIGMSLAVVA